VALRSSNTSELRDKLSLKLAQLVESAKQFISVNQVSHIVEVISFPLSRMVEVAFTVKTIMCSILIPESKKLRYYACMV
jgi:hypothetical protein